MNLTSVLDELNAVTGGERLPEDRYSRLSYPKLLPMMKMRVERYRREDFGHIMTMRTKGPFGMELLTVSLMPNEGAAVPYLLVDIMQVGKKRTVFVEYYDCTAKKPPQPSLKAVWEKYRRLPEYDEKPHWYVSERTGYSLIKGGGAENDGELLKMITDSVSAYMAAALSAEKSEANLQGLAAFRERMIEEGNPSSSIMEKIFGKEGAADFFRACVMPLA